MKSSVKFVYYSTDELRHILLEKDLHHLPADRSTSMGIKLLGLYWPLLM